MRRNRCVCWLGVVLLFGLSSQAQVTTGTISGTVMDATGAVLPGATVVILNEETGVSRTVSSDAAGRYSAPSLSLGRYRATASLEGFQTEVRSGIVLTVGRQAIVNFELPVGAVTQTIEVTGEAPLVTTTHAMVGGHVDERQIQQLPLNARSYTDLAMLQAGTLRTYFKFSGPTGLGYTGTHITIAGTRPTSTTFLLDGTMTTSVQGSAPSSIAGLALGVDAIREFEVITSPYSAEYGRGSGGSVSVVSKSGTNRFRGSVFYFHRNDNLDAASFFDRWDPISGRKVAPEFKRNQFGFSLGGPIVRDRTFFFGNYEGLRQRLGETNRTRIPNLEARQGIVRGQTVPISPGVRPYLELYPEPQGRDFGDGTAEFIWTYSRPINEDLYSVRIDHQFSPNNSFFGRYTISDGIDNRLHSLGLIGIDDTSRSQYVTLEQKSVLSPTLLNVARFGFTRNLITSDEKTLVDLDPVLEIQAGAGLGRIAFGLAGTDILPLRFIDNTFEFYNSLNYMRGRHSVKVGGQIQRAQVFGENHARQATRWSFSTLEDYLQGKARRVELAPRELADPARYLRQTFVGGFIQDDIRVSQRWTLNLGLRYEWAGTVTEKFGKLARIPEELLATATFDDIVTGHPWYNNPGITFGPRVGLAWDPFGDSRTAVRAGFGVFYDHVWAWWGRYTTNFRNPPFYNSFIFDSVVFPTKMEQFVKQLREQQGREVPIGNIMLQFAENPAQQRVLRYSLEVQQQLAGDVVVKVGYNGTRGIHVARPTEMNPPDPDRFDDKGLPVFSLNPRLRNPVFTQIGAVMTDSDSFYNALLVELTKSFSRGFQFQAAYTWSKAIDEGSRIINAGPFGGPDLRGMRDFRRVDRALAAFDVRHNFVSSFGVELPFGIGRAFDLSGVANTLFGGWELNTIISFASGRPESLDQGTTATTALLPGSRRPDLIPGGNNNPVLGGPDQYFDSSQFVFAHPQRLGNVGRNTLIGPGLANVDFSLIKNVEIPAVGEDFRIAFRAEFFNLFNRANFGSPGTSVFDGRGRPTAAPGRITDTVTTARQIQFGLRLTW